MKNCTFLKYLLLCIVLLTLNFVIAQDFNIQHLQRDVPRTGATSSITAVSSLNNAFVLNNNNRKAQAGRSDLNSGNQSARDLSGAVRLTATNTLTYYRESNSVNSNTRFDASVWEYTGAPGGANEFIVRGRYTVNLNGATNSVTQALSGISNANRCIPFITGIISNVSSEGAHTGTAIAYLENTSTLRVEKGSDFGNVTVYITLVEFTGSNWTVLHGDSGNSGNQTGTITLRANSNGTGTATNVTNWSNAIIFDHHRGDTSGNNRAIAHNWPLFRPGSNNQRVNWIFDGNHSSNGTNRHFVHVLNNPEINIYRFIDTENNGAGQNTFNISSASLTNINQSLIVGTSISSGGGTAYGRGWRNYYLNSITEASHWSHRGGNTMDHEIQIINLVNPAPEIEISGNGIEIINNDATPSLNDHTDFGDVPFPAGSKANSFLISNLGGANNLNLTGAAPYVTITGPNAADFTVTTAPATPIAAGNNTTFAITFTPSALGLRTALVSIANNDADENPYTFNIQGTGIVPPPCGSDVIHNADFESNNDGWLLGGSDASRLNNSARAYSNNHSIRLRNSGTMTLTNLDFNGYNKIDVEFFFFAEGMETNKNFHVEYRPNGSAAWIPVSFYRSNGNTVGNGGDFINNNYFARTATLNNTDFTFPASATAQIRIRNQGSDNSDMIYIDKIAIYGTSFCVPTLAPGGIASGLTLWLKADQVTGSTVQGDNTAVDTWFDTGQGHNAKVVDPANGAIGKPVFKNNQTDNVNFNPVITFDNDPSTAPKSFTYLEPNRDFLHGTGGFNTQELYVVVVPDITVNRFLSLPMDLFCSQNTTSNTWEEDVTGVGFGNYSARFSNEMLAFAIDANTGYGIAQTGNTVYNSNSVLLLSTRNKTSGNSQELYLNGRDVGDTEVAVSQFFNSSNRRFWLGRSQPYAGSFNGRIAEVISYDSRKNDGVERPRIESYLSIKYGITQGVNGVSTDYVDSNGTLIWDQSNNIGYNFDIAGIGRDDASDLEQKQSRSINFETDANGRTRGILTVGLTEIYDTNYDNKTLNANALNDREFLMWGDNGADLNSAATTIMVDMSADIPGLSTEVSFTAMQRIWKFVETGGDVPTVKLRIPQNAIRNINPPGSFYMFISDTGVFDPTAAYTLMVDDGNGNLETTYNFDGTKYITFGYAPQIEVERSIYFNGITDFIDIEDKINLNPAGFTISAWIKRDSGSVGSSSIVSKRNSTFSNGYDLRILDDNRIQMVWRNGTLRSINSNTSIPSDEWHHVAVIYNGTTISLYIDGIRDNQANRVAPIASNEYFYIGAAARNSPMQFFRGNIDEVRVWNINLSESQLRFVMNQEIQENSGFTNGKILPTNITKYDIGNLPWNELEAYYPMSVYTYTNTDDASGKGNQGALRNLRTVDYQTAPLPYISESDGDWNDKSTWLNGAVQYIPGSNSIVDPEQTVDWNIVVANHNIIMENSTIHPIKNNLRSVLSLDLQNSGVLTLKGENSSNDGNGLLVSHYLKLDGVIDLEGESQLIQNKNSDLDPRSSGRLERDQQGTADVFTYNYWSSPVGTRNSTTNNNSYTVPTVLRDGNNPINFISSGYNGSNTSPIGIADFWIWKFANQPTGQYSAWQHVRSTGSILVGEGFTMKGPGTGAIADDQNYVFNGKPNNGDINLTLAANNDYLVGNPYPSALNAEQFIRDNGPSGTNSLSGTLYFWEHWGGGSHILQQYQGGYATFNLSGGSPSASQGTSHPDVGMGGTPRKTPGRYIPVSQGFFVTAAGSGGTINFNNGQRIFEKEDGSLLGNSVFMRSFNENYYRIVENENDPRMKFRIGLKSVNEIQRQLLLTIDEKATVNTDWGYDAILNETQIDDLYWLIEDNKYIIQGSDVLDEFVRYPVGIKLASAGMNEISINVLENVPADITVYVHDKNLDYYHNLNQNPYEFHSMAGEHLNRFDILFNKEDAALSVGDDEFKSLNAVYANDNESIILINPTLIEVKSMELLNVIGQSITKVNNISVSPYSEYEVKNLSSGTYIIKMNTASGSVSKKVLID